MPGNRHHALRSPSGDWVAVATARQERVHLPPARLDATRSLAAAAKSSATAPRQQARSESSARFACAPRLRPGHTAPTSCPACRVCAKGSCRSPRGGPSRSPCFRIGRSASYPRPRSRNAQSLPSSRQRCCELSAHSMNRPAHPWRGFEGAAIALEPDDSVHHVTASGTHAFASAGSHPPIVMEVKPSPGACRDWA